MRQLAIAVLVLSCWAMVCTSAATAPAAAAGGSPAATAKAAAKAAAKQKQALKELDEAITGKPVDLRTCIDYCHKSVGVCSEVNEKACACAAGCNCDAEGFMFDTCDDHCSTENDSQFYIEIYPNPKRWTQPIAAALSGGSTFLGSALTGNCHAGCMKRGKCHPKCCRKHPRCDAVGCPDCAAAAKAADEHDEL